MAIEHKPWIGSHYSAGIAGSKLLIVGFSHHGRYSEEEEDSADFTNSVMKHWALPGHIRFFNDIPGYFGAGDNETFWHSVAFANTLPTTVGDSDKRYSGGTPEQRGAVPERVLRLVAELMPDRIFVFSRKGWKLWPDYTGDLRNGTLRVPDVGEFDAGTYRHAHGEAIAFGFRHPQYAPAAPMRAAVAAALQAGLADLAPYWEG